MSATVTCIRCGQTREGFEKPPFPGPVGARVVEGVCQVCWSEWVKQQMMLINHYGLNLMDPSARGFLTRQMSAFLFGAGDQEEIDTTKKGTISY